MFLTNAFMSISFLNRKEITKLYNKETRPFIIFTQFYSNLYFYVQLVL